MAQPTDIPYFATDDENDPITGSANKTIPSQEKRDSGQKVNKNTLRQDINYLFNEGRKWIVHFRDQTQPDDSVMVLKGTHTFANVEATISDQMGGTWSLISGGDPTVVIGGEDMYVLKKVT